MPYRITSEDDIRKAQDQADASDLQRAASALERRMARAGKKSWLIDVLIGTLRKVAASMESRP